MQEWSIEPQQQPGRHEVIDSLGEPVSDESPMVPLPFRIKICGITSVADARACVEAGADAIGLNFYAPSSRSIAVERAEAIVAVVPESVTLVGLFVNEVASRVNEVAGQLGLGWVQLHGDEPPGFLSQLDRHLSIVRAYRFEGWQTLQDDLSACEQGGRMPSALLMDAKVDGSYGGTGAQADWQALASRPGPASNCPLVLAGGLTARNVAEAIEWVRPEGVDTASGVEKSPGVKDPGLIESFVTAANNAFEGG